ncbi:MAG TPA: DNA primase [Chloroflexi bacterium]|jgi:DNA primase|nr:DNA primase [Chloroflexota bacterium]
MSITDEIKSRIDIVEFIGGYVPLQKAGRNYKGLCPFHSEKTPSFVVFPDTQGWHCFGACGTGGDIFTFLMRRENMEFREALEFLAQRAGITLRPLDDVEIQMRDELDRLRGLNAAAADIYHRILMETRPGEAAKRYLERRGVTAETMRTFNLGYAPDEWHILEPRLRQLGYSEAEIIEAGLANKSSSGNVYDRFRGRVMFPIRDAQGRVIGFGGRLLSDVEGQPKYLNTPQTPLFDKGSILYGIDLARHAIRESGTAVIVEGYMDVVVPYQCGVRNLVACMGTALTEEHLEQLKLITKRLVLALDPDAAGIRATERGIETARQALATRVVPVPTPTGLIRYEEQLQAEICILVLPDGLDPDELVLSDRERWDALVAEALPVAEYAFQRVMSEVDLSQAKGKREAVERLLPVISAMDSAVERSHYLQRLAQHIHMDERLLWSELSALRGETGRRRPGERRPVERARREPSVGARGPSARAPREGLSGGLEERALALLLSAPALLPEMREVTGLSADEFQDVRNRQVYVALERLTAERGDALVSMGAEDVARYVGQLDTELAGHVESVVRILRSGPPLSADMVREDLTKVSVRLRRDHLGRLLRELRFMLQDAQEEGDEERVQALNHMIDPLARDYLDVDRRSYAVTLVGRSKREYRIRDGA